MLLAAEVDGGRFRPAQFTRIARDASIEAEVEPCEGRLRLQIVIQGRPDSIEGLLRVLRNDGARVEGTLSAEGFSGTYDVEIGLVDHAFLLHLSALRHASESLRLRIRGGRMGISGEVAPAQVDAWKKALSEIDGAWSMSTAEARRTQAHQL